MTRIHAAVHNVFNEAYDMASSSNSEENKKLPPLEKLPDVVEEPKPVYKEVWVSFLSVRDKYIFIQPGYYGKWRHRMQVTPQLNVYREYKLYCIDIVRVCYFLNWLPSCIGISLIVI